MANRSFCQRAFHFGSKKDIHRLALQKIQFSVGAGLIPPHRQQLKPKGDQNQTKAEKRKALYDGNHDDRHGANRVGCR